jgi:transcriptional regulator with PAS, ATPase and Fis domain
MAQRREGNWYTQEMLTLIADCFGRNILFPLRDDLTELRGGSLPDNTIYLPYKGVSRHHFTLNKQDSKWILRDLGSKNGTMLNGKLITEASIKTGDVIQAGIIQLLVKPAREEVQPLQLSETQSLRHDPETDRVGHVPVSEEEHIFTFHQLRFPEGFIPGKSAAMGNVFQKLQAIADSDVNVLLIGETGVGKEMFAQTLHQSSKRSQGPFVAVNCAAIPADLAEAELFGIGEKVATDVSARKGKILLAHQGTLFLDELSSFPESLQAKILRTIEDHAIYPVGEHKAQISNFRLISATNQNPKDLIEKGKLREDLYHRIATVEIQIPALRERKGDLELLIMGLLQNLSRNEGKYIPGISQPLFAALHGYSYPGNVRELRNILSAMVALAHPGEVLDLHLLPEKVRDRNLKEDMDNILQEDLGKDSIHLHETIDEVTRKLIQHALKLHQGNITRAAQYLNVTPFGMRKMMKRLSISKDHPQ